jgi:hypothetical protein
MGGAAVAPLKAAACASAGAFSHGDAGRALCAHFAGLSLGGAAVAECWAARRRGAPAGGAPAEGPLAPAASVAALCASLARLGLGPVDARAPVLGGLLHADAVARARGGGRVAVVLDAPEAFFVAPPVGGGDGGGGVATGETCLRNKLLISAAAGFAHVVPLQLAAWLACGACEHAQDALVARSLEAMGVPLPAPPADGAAETAAARAGDGDGTGESEDEGGGAEGGGVGRIDLWAPPPPSVATTAPLLLPAPAPAAPAPAAPVPAAPAPAAPVLSGEGGALSPGRALRAAAAAAAAAAAEAAARATDAAAAADAAEAQEAEEAAAAHAAALEAEAAAARAAAAAPAKAVMPPLGGGARSPAEPGARALPLAEPRAPLAAPPEAGTGKGEAKRARRKSS